MKRRYTEDQIIKASKSHGAGYAGHDPGRQPLGDAAHECHRVLSLRPAEGHPQEGHRDPLIHHAHQGGRGIFGVWCQKGGHYQHGALLPPRGCRRHGAVSRLARLRLCDWTGDRDRRGDADMRKTRC